MSVNPRRLLVAVTLVVAFATLPGGVPAAAVPAVAVSDPPRTSTAATTALPLPIQMRVWLGRFWPDLGCTVDPNGKCVTAPPTVTHATGPGGASSVPTAGTK
jgi:hypothetical protein